MKVSHHLLQNKSPGLCQFNESLLVDMPLLPCDVNKCVGPTKKDKGCQECRVVLGFIEDICQEQRSENRQFFRRAQFDFNNGLVKTNQRQ